MKLIVFFINSEITTYFEDEVFQEIENYERMLMLQEDDEDNNNNIDAKESAEEEVVYNLELEMSKLNQNKDDDIKLETFLDNEKYQKYKEDNKNIDGDDDIKQINKQEHSVPYPELGRGGNSRPLL